MTPYALEQLAVHVGQELGSSDWLAVEQDRIDLFADATDDHQWIHVDPARAAGGPFGATIAHGYLTLSLLPVLVGQAFSLDGVSRRINYGLDKVRFPSPVTVGSRVRAVVMLASAVTSERSTQMALRCTVEIEGGDRPACVAETLTVLMP